MFSNFSVSASTFDSLGYQKSDFLGENTSEMGLVTYEFYQIKFKSWWSFAESINTSFIIDFLMRKTISDLLKNSHLICVFEFIQSHLQRVNLSSENSLLSFPLFYLQLGCLLQLSKIYITWLSSFWNVPSLIFFVDFYNIRLENSSIFGSLLW